MAKKKVYPFIHVGSFVNGEEVMIDAREVCFYYPAPSVKKADGHRLPMWSACGRARS